MISFTPTHVRRSVPQRRGKVEAEFLANMDGQALYKVRFSERGRETVRYTAASMGYFTDAFEGHGG